MYTVRAATIADHPSIATLIDDYQMVPPMFGHARSQWWVSCDARGRVVACIGAEQGDSAWLLRSAIVATSARGHGLGRQLTVALITAAQQQGIRHIYCFSTDAGDFWQHMGFAHVPVADVLTMLPDAPQIAQFERLGWLPSEVAWRYDT